MKVRSPLDTHVRPIELVRFGSVVQRLSWWAELMGISYRTIHYRMAQGDTVLDALRPTNCRRPELRFELDAKVRELVAENPSGMTLLEVATHFGLTRERVRQIQEVALAKVARQLGPEWADHIDTILASRDGEEIAA